MSRLTTTAAFARSVCLALVALFLALRVIASAGYMPQLENGRLTLMLCPDGEWTALTTSMAGMKGHQERKAAQHPQCAYAAAAAMSFVSGGSGPLLPLVVSLLFVVILALPSLARTTHCERPYSTGPPLPA